VAAPYADHGRNTGTIGVIWPTRMNYAKVVPIVAATATAMSQYMDRTGQKEQEGDNGEDD
jgi:heat-inducible transcriptional repressor